MIGSVGHRSGDESVEVMGVSMRRNVRFVAIGVGFLLFLGCATTGTLMNLQLQQSKDDVIKTMGKPTAARGSITNKFGQVIEVWEYGLYKTSDDAFYSIRTFYWL